MKIIQSAIFVLILFNVFTQKEPLALKENGIKLFEKEFSDSLPKYLLLGQDDVVFALYIEIKPLTKEFVYCIKCNEGAIQYLNIDLLKETFFRFVDKSNLAEINKTFKYKVYIDSISNEYKCTRFD